MATSKTPAKKPAAKKLAVAKKPATKKPVAKKISAKARSISAEERYKMIEVAAYYIAERNSFKGNTLDFWTAAETEINKAISK